MTTHILAVILAGGRGRRLGGVDKASVALAGRPLIVHVAERLKFQVDEILINANGDPARFEGYVVLPDDSSSHLDGPFLGLAAAFTAFAAARLATHLLIVPTDTPFLPHDLVAQLMQGMNEASAAFATTPEGVQPAISLWARPGADKAVKHLTAFAGESLHKFLRECGAVAVSFVDASAFLNINSPADLMAAERRI